MDEIASEQATPPLSPAHSLERLQGLGQKVVDLTREIEELEAQVALKKQERYRIRTRDMIDLMDEAGVTIVGVGAVTFVPEVEYHASVPEKRRDEAHDYLERIGAGDLIDRQLVVSFPREFADEAARLAEYVRLNYQMAQTEQKRAVPWARLTSWFKEYVSVRMVREKLPPLDRELLGATGTRQVRVDGLPKPKSKSKKSGRRG